MKKIVLVLAVVGLAGLFGCEGPPGVPGPQGPPGYTVESEVFELLNVNFGYDTELGYNIYETLNPPILDSDVILIYRLSGTIDPQTPIWQLIPRTLYLPQGELDYDFDFSPVDFAIYAGGTYNLALTPSFIQNQTFRIVIIPGYFSKNLEAVDTADYQAVIKAFHIDDRKVKILNK
jgi:hypothetical protein